MIERSLVLIKPDGVERNLVGNIINVYEEHGLKICALEMIHTDKDLAAKHYDQHKEKPFFEDLLTYLTRSPLVAIVFEGEDAVNKIRKLNGATDPTKAESGTIRNKFARSISENCVHASDSAESAENEIRLWFPDLK